MSYLISRQKFGIIFINTYQSGHLLSNLLMVARQHHGVLHAKCLQASHSLSTSLLDAIVHHHGSTFISLYKHLAMRQGSRFVEHNGSYFGKRIHIITSLNQDTIS